MASRTSTALATLALAALSIAAVLTLGRVFQSGRFVLPVVGAVLLAHALGFVARTRGWSLVDALSLSMTGLAVYLIWVLAPHTTLYAIPTLLGISIITFIIVRLAPGDPIRLYTFGSRATNEDIEALRHVYGLDLPMPIQYINWLGDILHGNFGQSFIYHQDAAQLFVQYIMSLGAHGAHAF